MIYELAISLVIIVITVHYLPSFGCILVLLITMVGSTTLPSIIIILFVSFGFCMIIVSPCAGIPIDKIALMDQETHNYVGEKLLELTLMELFFSVSCRHALSISQTNTCV